MDLGLQGSRVLNHGRGSRASASRSPDAVAAEGAAVGLVARDAEGLAQAAERLASRSVPGGHGRPPTSPNTGRR